MTSVTIETSVLRGVDGHRATVTARRSSIDKLTLEGWSEVAGRDLSVRLKCCDELRQAGLLHGVHLTLGGSEGQTSATDMAAALAIWALAGKMDPAALHHTLVVGQLTLGGAFQTPARGLLCHLHGAQQRGLEKALVGGSAAAHERQGLDIAVKTQRTLTASWATPEAALIPTSQEDLSLDDVQGNEAAKDALRLGAQHHQSVLLIGPPGSGKTMLARRAVGLIEPPSFELELLQRQIRSAAGLPAMQGPAFRAPHHTCSRAGLIGGGAPVRPGEVSLAHGGVLFLDELMDFRYDAIAELKRVIEQGYVDVEGVRMPAKPAMVIGAINPCPCGYMESSVHPCKCSGDTIFRYYKHLEPLFKMFTLRTYFNKYDPFTREHHDGQD